MAFVPEMIVPVRSEYTLRMGEILPEHLVQVPRLPEDSIVTRPLSPNLKRLVGTLPDGGELYEKMAQGNTSSWGWHVSWPGQDEQLVGFSMIDHEPDMYNNNTDAVQLVNWVPETWGKGLATAANKAHLLYGFRVRKLARMCCVMYLSSDGSYNSFKNVGFITRKIQPAMFPLPGEAQSFTRWMHIFNHEFPEGRRLADPFAGLHQTEERVKREQLEWASENVRIAV